MEEFSDCVRELGLAYLYGIERKPNETDEELAARVRLEMEEFKEWKLGRRNLE